MKDNSVGRAVYTAAVLVGLTSALAQDFAIPWHTVDGGGWTVTSGGDFELSGTIGQPDAGSLTGGAFTLTGGFWLGLAVDD